MSLVDLRDLAIVILAALFILVGLLMVVLAVLLIGLAAMIRGKLGPILDSARGTLTNIEGTSGFVSETVVQPIVRVASFAAGARRAMGILTGLSKKREGKNRRR
jgi:hypothetical protein